MWIYALGELSRPVQMMIDVCQYSILFTIHCNIWSYEIDGLVQRTVKWYCLQSSLKLHFFCAKSLFSENPSWQCCQYDLSVVECAPCGIRFRARVLNKPPVGQIRPANQFSLALWSPLQYIEIHRKSWESGVHLALEHIFEFLLALHEIYLRTRGFRASKIWIQATANLRP